MISAARATKTAIQPTHNDVYLCECGCGKPTPIAQRTDTKRGYVPGRPKRFINGHGNRLSPVEAEASRERRFWAKVDRSGGPDACWPWTACMQKGGYGRFGWESYEVIGAHVAVLRLVGREIPPGYEPDHLCGLPSCCNPAHIEVVTAAINRSRASYARWEGVPRRVECKKGHPMSGENLIVQENGATRCRICTYAQARANAARRRVAK